MQLLWLTLASALGGYAVFRLSHEILCLIHRSDSIPAQVWDYEEVRRSELRQHSLLFRWFEPLACELETQAWLHWLGDLPSIERSLAQGGSELPWSARQYLAVGTLRMTLAALFSWLVMSSIFGIVLASLLAIGVWIMGIVMLPRQVAGLARVRMRRFKQRLPFAIDLMALMMEAGGDFRQSLSIVVRENHGHPVGVEFARIAKAYAAGQPLRECLDQLQARLRDEDVNEIVFSVKNADELGVPLSHTFLTLAEQMRLKHAQLAEKIIGQRKTMMAFPAWLIMIACLIIAVAPVVLGALHGNVTSFR